MIAQPQQYISGAAYMLLAMLCFSIMSACVYHAATQIHSTQIVLLRSIIMTIIIASWIMIRHGSKFLKTNQLHKHILRALFGFGATELWFLALSHMPINDATALSFTSPIFATLLAILFLKERSTLSRWCAVLLGFIGSTIILQPNTNQLSDAAYMVLTSAFLLAMLSILLKSLTKTEHPDSITFYSSLLMIPLASIPAIFYWQPITLGAFLWIVTITIFGLIAHLALVRAFALTEMTLLMPLDFTRLIFTAIIAYLWFGEILDLWTLVGAAIIIAAAVWSAVEGNDLVKRRLRHLLSSWQRQ